MLTSWVSRSIGLGLLCASIVAGAADAVTVRLKWFNQAQFAGYYVAKQKGFYQEAGLDVSIQPGGPDFPAVQMVAGGNEQFGVTGADQILVARGKGVPVVAVAGVDLKKTVLRFFLQSPGLDAPAPVRRQENGLKVGGEGEIIYPATFNRDRASRRDPHQ